MQDEDLEVDSFLTYFFPEKMDFLMLWGSSIFFLRLRLSVRIFREILSWYLRAGRWNCSADPPLLHRMLDNLTLTEKKAVTASEECKNKNSPSTTFRSFCQFACRFWTVLEISLCSRRESCLSTPRPCSHSWRVPSRHKSFPHQSQVQLISFFFQNQTSLLQHTQVP